MNRVGGQDLTAYITQLLGDEAQARFTDARLNRLLAQAISDYSTVRPYVVDTTLTTVADQALYALPDDTLTIVSVEYRNENAIETNDDWMAEWNLSGLDFLSDEALAIVRQKLRLNYYRAGDCSWALVSNTISYAAGMYLYLYPTPSEGGNTVRIRYGKVHPLIGTDYSTVPTSHVGHLRDWVLALCNLQTATGRIRRVQDYDAGQTRFRSSGSTQDLYGTAIGEIERIKGALSVYAGEAG